MKKRWIRANSVSRRHLCRKLGSVSAFFCARKARRVSPLRWIHRAIICRHTSAAVSVCIARCTHRKSSATFFGVGIAPCTHLTTIIINVAGIAITRAPAAIICIYSVVSAAGNLIITAGTVVTAGTTITSPVTTKTDAQYKYPPKRQKKTRSLPYISHYHMLHYKPLRVVMRTQRSGFS